MTTHDVHRVMDENLFGPFSRPSSNFSSFRSLSATDLISLPGHRRPNVASSVTGSATGMPLQYKCRPSSDILQTQPTLRDKTSPEGKSS